MLAIVSVLFLLLAESVNSKSGCLLSNREGMSFELSAECLAARPTGPCTWDGSGPAHVKYRSRAARTSVRVPGVLQFSRVLSQSGSLSLSGL